MKSYRKSLAAIIAACFITAAAFAADASPTGTWKWSQQGRGGNPPTERSVQLELKDGKLTGTLKGFEGPQGQIPDTALTATSFKDGMIAFTTELTFGENKFAIKYSGKLEGDTIKGSIERPGFNGGDPTKVDWAATRVK